MRGKLTLKLDDLRVDTFDTTDPRGERGTVVGQQQCTCDVTCPFTCADGTCGGIYDTTCNCTVGGHSCAGTCGATCPFTCADGTCGGIYDTTCNCTVNGYSCAGGC
jgi:hypothetical protein